MNHDEMLAVITAHRDGKEIQFRRYDYGGGRESTQWHDVNMPKWDVRNGEYRIKPEPPKPREFWLCPNSRPSIFDYKAYDCPQSGAENIHVREVLPE